MPQTFGGMTNWNPHVHALITDTCWDSEDNYYPTLARNFDVSDPLDWIARITAHIPRKGAKQIIYYGEQP